MSELIKQLSESGENCLNHPDGILEGHRFDEVYGCLFCVEEGVRTAERERIIKLLERVALADEEPCEHGKSQNARCGMCETYLTPGGVIDLIKGEDDAL